MHVTTIFIIFQSFICGLLAVYTPYYYALIPINIHKLSGTTTRNTVRHIGFFVFFVIFIFTLFGAVVSFIIDYFGIGQYTGNWLFQLILCRLFLGLGLSFFGAFELSLPKSWKKVTHERGSVGTIGGIFYMALTLPVLSFSSIGPIICMVLLMAGIAKLLASVAALFGFAIGLVLPYIYPKLINMVSPPELNQVKVSMGFIAWMVAVKFLFNGCQDLGLAFFDRSMFIVVFMALSILLCVYMLGLFKLPHDYVPSQNMYGQEYVTIARFIIAILSLSFALYLLPGLLGNPLSNLSKLLPPK